MIKMTAIGYLGKDAILNNVNGKNVINFNVAHAEKFKDAQGNSKEKTTWVDCSYWTDKTGVVPYLKKGSHVYVEGQPDVRSYTTQDGRQGANLVLRVSSINLLGSNGGNGNNQQSGDTNGQGIRTAPSELTDLNEPLDSLPF